MKNVTPIIPDVQSARGGLIFGFIMSVILGAAFVFSALKAGITPGISPLMVLFGWVALGAFFRKDLKGFLAMAQVTGSAGLAVTAGVVFVAPLAQILAENLGVEVPKVDVAALILAALAGCFLGWGFVGLATKRFLSDPKLPAPEAVACDRLIQTAVARPDDRPPLVTSLVPGLVLGSGMGLMTQLGLMRETLTELKIKAFGGVAKMGLPAAPLYFGIGALLSIPTAILIFSGGVLNAVVKAVASAHGMEATTYRWVGGAAMVVAVVYSLIDYVRTGQQKRAAAADSPKTSKVSEYDRALLELSPQTLRELWGAIAVGGLLLAILMLYTGGGMGSLITLGSTAFILIFLLSGLGALLSLQVGSSASPVSGTVFMGMLVLSLVGLAIGLRGQDGVYFLVPIIVAACTAICASNDSSQDYKTMQLNGLKVESCFRGQLLGLIGGAVSVPVALYVAHESGGLGSAALPAPQATFFATVLQTIFLNGSVPLQPVLAGLALGFLAVGLEIYGKKRGLILSSLAFAVGLYLPSEIGTGMLMGSLARALGARGAAETTHTGILMAAGLITGDALFALFFGCLAVAGIELVGFGEELGSISQLTALVGCLATLGLIFWNYRPTAKS